MSDKGVEKRHSKTAIFAALYRAVANKEFKNERLGPDHIAVQFLPFPFKLFVRFKKIRTKITDKDKKITPGVYEYMIARTAFFDNAFADALNNYVSQIVLLGAGYDTRAYRFANLNNTTNIFELDISTTQNRKKKCLRKAGINLPEHVKLVPIDFNRESLIRVLADAGYKNNEETLFIWEGVSYYLEPESVETTLEFVNNSSHNTSVIAFDYAISISEEKIKQYYGAKEFIQTWKKHRSDESFRFTIDESQMVSYLKQRGLKIISHLNPHEIEKTFLLNAKGLTIGQINGLFRFVLASPNK